MFKIYPRRRALLLLLWLPLLALVACGRGAVQEPEVPCNLTAGADEAVLCLKGVSVELGPADQVTAYNDLPGMVLLFLPDPAAGRGISATDDPNAFGLTVETIVQLQQTIANSYSADEKGELALALEPGEAVLCAATRSLVEAGGGIAGCRRLRLDAGVEHRLLIRYNPWGGFLAFDWQSP